ncbi:hypothetical protein AC1031_003010 [Aphanomyces cochlioides]|nr:hypothetical protein AC1031_003010 [Aphanomyces cochlioides]
MSQLKSRHDTIKGMFAILSKIVDSSGMGWEATRCRVECRSTTWDELLKDKPKSWRVWQNKRFPQYDHCESLFRGTLATGHFASASSAPQNSLALYEHDSPHDSNIDQLQDNTIDEETLLEQSFDNTMSQRDREDD